MPDQYAYRLLEQLEKIPAPSTPATLSVGPRFGMFPDGMTGSPYVPAYGYRWLETLERTPSS